MTFHSTTAPRIRETDTTRTVEHRATLHYSDTNRDVGVNDTVVVVESEKINHENRNL